MNLFDSLFWIVLLGCLFVGILIYDIKNMSREELKRMMREEIGPISVSVLGAEAIYWVLRDVLKVSMYLSFFGFILFAICTLMLAFFLFEKKPNT